MLQRQAGPPLPQLSYSEGGRGRPLVLLPAFPADARLYGGLLEYPPCRVIAVDPPGFGRTAASATAPSAFSVEAYADSVTDLIARLGLDRPLLGGTGFGGYVAIELASRPTAELAGLILVGCVAAPDPPAKRPLRETLAILALTDGLVAVADQQLERALPKSAEPAVRATFRRMIEESDPQGFAAMSRGLALRPDPAIRLAAICVPTLVIAGEEDPYAAPADVAHLAERIPGATFEMVPAAGHLLALERSDALRDHLVRWLAAAPVVIS